jgi:uncharacterized protein YjiS (DUF1127 family)
MGSIVKKKRTLLHDEPSIVLQPEMVRRLGNLTDAAVLQQLNYWMPHAKVEHEGRRWVYKTYDNWGKEIGISGQQVRRAIERLEALGVVVSCTPRGRTKHYAINYEHDMLDGASSPDSYQADSPDDGADSPDNQASSPTYKDLHETRQEITLAAAPKKESAKKDQLFEAIAAACNIDWTELTRTGRGQLNTAAKELRDIGVTPEQVPPKAAAYRKRYPEAQLTPTALVKHWAGLQGGHVRRPNSRPQCDYCHQPLDDHDPQVCRDLGGFR